MAALYFGRVITTYVGYVCIIPSGVAFSSSLSLVVFADANVAAATAVIAATEKIPFSLCAALVWASHADDPSSGEETDQLELNHDSSNDDTREQQ